VELAKRNLTVNMAIVVHLFSSRFSAELRFTAGKRSNNTASFTYFSLMLGTTKLTRNPIVGTTRSAEFLSECAG
jgi:hypothetical protein